jgi:DNA-binding NarL/FixJ family response regulator
LFALCDQDTIQSRDRPVCGETAFIFSWSRQVIKPIRIVLVDDHDTVRQGLRAILDPDLRFEVVAEAANGANALRVVAALRPDVVLLDLELPDVSGIDLCRQMLKVGPEAAVLILTACLDRDLVHIALQAGACGYLLKDAETLDLQDRILSVMSGNIALGPRATAALADDVHPSDLRTDMPSLREIDILRLIAHGLRDIEIAERLHLDEQAVKGHVRQILLKLGARSRVQAVLVARERGAI